jgi:hypothetical protein
MVILVIANQGGLQTMTSLHGQSAMARRIDFEKHRFDGRSKVSVRDEREFRDRDAASRWLERAEEKANNSQFARWKRDKKSKTKSVDRGIGDAFSPKYKGKRPPWE